MKKRHRKNTRDPEYIYIQNVENRYKPSKNQFWCPHACRAKMQFETKREAYLFIKYNGDKVGTYLRSYYCSACACWHITSQSWDQHLSIVDDIHRNRQHQDTI